MYFWLLLKYLQTPSEKLKAEYNLFWLFLFPVWISLYLFLIMSLSVYSTYLFLFKHQKCNKNTKTNFERK